MCLLVGFRLIVTIALVAFLGTKTDNNYKFGCAGMSAAVARRSTDLRSPENGSSAYGTVRSNDVPGVVVRLSAPIRVYVDEPAWLARRLERYGLKQIEAGAVLARPRTCSPGRDRQT